MKTLYLDLTAGAAGDMLSGALYGLCPDRDALLDALRSLPLPGLEIVPEPLEGGVHLAVTFHGQEEHETRPHHHHPHRTLAGVLRSLRALPLPAPVRKDASAVYELLAQAEAKAHGVPVAEIHFHEVGMDDAIVDIVATSLLLHSLAPDQVLATPVATGSGTVRCAHGELPVPAPATAHLLKGIPTVPGPASGELCTPTGAALLKYFVDRFETLPAPLHPSYGYGRKRFETHRNAVAAWLVEMVTGPDSV